MSERSACAVCASRQCWEPDYSVGEGVLAMHTLTIEGRAVHFELHRACEEALLVWAKDRIFRKADQELQAMYAKRAAQTP